MLSERLLNRADKHRRSAIRKFQKEILKTTKSVLAVHTAVSYTRKQGLGIGLVQRVACARTGLTKEDVLKTHVQGFGLGRDAFNALETNPHTRADLLALMQALCLATNTIKRQWPEDVAPTTVVVLLGRPCDEVLEIIKHHIEHEPKSLKQMNGPNYATIMTIIRQIHSIKRHGFKVKIAMSDHHSTRVQATAADEAERRFNKVCRAMKMKKMGGNLSRRKKGWMRRHCHLTTRRSDATEEEAAPSDLLQVMKA